MKCLRLFIPALLLLVIGVLLFSGGCTPTQEELPPPHNPVSGRVAQPTAHPAGGPDLDHPASVPLGRRITLHTTTPGATVYVTLDGTYPALERSGTTYRYEEPIPIIETRPTVFRAVAVKEGMLPSEALTVVYRGIWTPPVRPTPPPPPETAPPPTAPPPGVPDWPAPIWNADQGFYYDTIQSAIDDSSPGDTIYVLPGTYRENIVFDNKHITLRYFTDTVDKPVIDGAHNGPVVPFTGGDTSTLTNFTLQNGEAKNGGGIYVTGRSSPSITNNTIINNQADKGGGIYVSERCNPYLGPNIISDNRASKKGGGIAVVGKSSAPVIQDNTISNNIAYSKGGGILLDCSTPTIEKNTITGNLARDKHGGGICVAGCFSLFWNTEGAVIMENSITDNKAGGYGGGMYKHFWAYMMLPGGGFWVADLCPPDEVPHNTVHSNTHQGGQRTDGCDYYPDWTAL